MSNFYKIHFAGGKTRTAVDLSLLQGTVNDAYEKSGRPELVIDDLARFTDVMLTNPYAAANAGVKIELEDAYELVMDAKSGREKAKSEMERHEDFIKVAANALITDEESLLTFLSDTNSIAAHVKTWMTTPEKTAIVENLIKKNKAADEVAASMKSISAKIAKAFKTLDDAQIIEAFALVGLDASKSAAARGNGGFYAVKNIKKNKETGAILRGVLSLDSLVTLAAHVGVEVSA